MHIDLRKAPEVLRLIQRAGASYYHKIVAQILPFPGRLYLSSHWEGGTRYWYTLVALDGTARIPVPENGTPFAIATPEITSIPTGSALVETCVFRGKNMPAKIYVNPENMNQFVLTEAPQLTDLESKVLGLVCGLKSAYRREEAARQGISLADYEATIASLKGKKLLNAGGAVTPAGRNARPSRY